LATALFLSASTLASAAGPPVNDLFTNAQALSGADVSLSGETNVGATKEEGEPNHADNLGGASVWYRWTAPHTVWTLLDTIGSDFDTLLAVYTGSTVNNLTTIDASDDIETEVNLQSSLGFQATKGTTYRFAVDGYNHGSGAATGNISLHLHQEEVPAPPNDSFAKPTVLTSDGGHIYFNNGATKEPLEPAHAGNPGGASVWYSWTPSVNRLATIETCLSPMNTTVGIYTGNSLPALTEVASADEGCPEIDEPPPPPGGGSPMGEPAANQGSLVHFFAQAGTTYRIAVDGYNGEEGEIRLELYAAEPPASPAQGPTSPRTVRRLRIRSHPPRLLIEPTCEPGRYAGHVGLQQLANDGSYVGKLRQKSFRCGSRKAARKPRSSGQARKPRVTFKGSGYFRIPRTWWKQAHTKAGIMLVAQISRDGDPYPTSTPITLRKPRHRSRSRGHRKSSQDQRRISATRSLYPGTNSEVLWRGCSGPYANVENLDFGIDFNGRIAYPGEWITVVGWALPFWPGRGYGKWTRSYENVSYRVGANGTSYTVPYSAVPGANITYAFVGRSYGAHMSVLWPPYGYNTYAAGPGVWVLMAVEVWTQRTGWRFFDYVTPGANYGTSSSGAWCWHPYG
jgi:hypothetical protein